MYEKFFAVLCVAMMVLSVVACGSQSLTGKWAFGVNTYEFKDDDTVSISISGVLNYNGTYTTDGDKLTVTVSGLTGETTKEFTYQISGKTLSLTGDVHL